MLIDMGETIQGTILVHNSLMEMWNSTEKELLWHALHNTPSVSGYSIMKMAEFLDGFAETECSGCLKDIYILTNHEKLYGAGCMFYTGLLEQIAEEKRSGFYVLPSSIHEVLLIPDTAPDVETAGKLRDMVREINRSEIIRPEDFLSDEVYYYDRNRRTLSAAVH